MTSKREVESFTVGARKEKIEALENRLQGLRNDARYWDLIRTYGEHSAEVLRHLESCAKLQVRGENHT